MKGMAKAVADTDSGSNQGGFTTDGSNITGFSSMHDSGTGGSPSLGNFALFPYAGCTGDDVNGCVYPKKSRKTQFDNSTLKASPGYFGLSLVSGISVDMTTTHHTSLYRFKFPATDASGNSSSPLILMDLTDLSDSRQDNGSISVDDETGRMTGNARFLPSFGSGNYVAYFCADFSGAPIRDNGIFVNSRASTIVKDLKISRSINGYPLPGGAFVRFQSPGEILARVGVSFISSDQACSSAEKEIPSFDFAATQSAAEDMWREKISAVKVNTNGIERSVLTNFYSGIYRTMVNPQDLTSENPLWQSDEPYFDSFYW
jgi:putative alpha-1,2-mannosidase